MASLVQMVALPSPLLALLFICASTATLLGEMDTVDAGSSGAGAGSAVLHQQYWQPSRSRALFISNNRAQAVAVIACISWNGRIYAECEVRDGQINLFIVWYNLVSQRDAHSDQDSYKVHQFSHGLRPTRQEGAVLQAAKTGGGGRGPGRGEC